MITMKNIYKNQIQFRRKTLEFYGIILVIRFVFHEGNKYYPRVFCTN